jgi:hypothetical protein
MEISGRQLAAVAASIVLLLLAGVAHGADVACEKEKTASGVGFTYPVHKNKNGE